MPLSEYERKMLEELEAQLADEDPSFADTLKPEPVPESASMQLSIRHLVVGLLVSVLGIGVLVGGIAIEQVILGVLGVAILFAGFWYIAGGMQSGKGGKRSTGDRSSHPTDPSPDHGSAREPKSGGFMDRQAQMWEKRRRGEQ